MNSERRNFLQKLSLSIGSIAALPFVSSAKSFRNAFSTKPAQETILSMKPLGFQWDTQDPFLFCVHH